MSRRSRLLIPNGVNLERFQPRAAPPGLAARYGAEGKRVLLSVGRLVARKGADRLIEAMPPKLARALVLTSICWDRQEVGRWEQRWRIWFSWLSLKGGRRCWEKFPTAEIDDLYALAEDFRLCRTGKCRTGTPKVSVCVFLWRANARGKPVVVANRPVAPRMR